MIDCKGLKLALPFSNGTRIAHKPMDEFSLFEE
jgi:hypothetical protein